MRVNPLRLHNELLKANVPVEGVSSDGRIDFALTATPADRALAETIKAAHNPDANPERDANLAFVADLKTTVLVGQFDNKKFSEALALIDANVADLPLRAVLKSILKLVYENMAQSRSVL